MVSCFMLSSSTCVTFTELRLKNNFDPIFLEERINGLQTLVNAILQQPDLLICKEIQDFFCLNEPPVHSDSNEESRVCYYCAFLGKYGNCGIVGYV